MGNLARRLNYWLRRRRIDADLAEELETHCAMTQERLEKSGMAPSDAAYASRRALGNITLAREDARDVWVWSWLESVGRDVRVGFRALMKRPAFTAVAVATIALGVGANTAVFSLIDASVFRVLPVKDPHQLVFPRIVGDDGRSDNSFSYGLFERFRDQNRSLAAIVAYDNSRFTITIDGEPEMQRGEFVSGNYFEMLAIRPAAGRLLTSDDAQPGKEPVAVISHGYWTSRFSRSPAAIGKAITVGTIPVIVVGVMPAQFQGRMMTSGWSDIVLPMSLHAQLRLRDHTTFGLMARLKPDVKIERATEDLNGLHRQFIAETAGNAIPERVPRIALKPGIRGELPLLGRERPLDTKQTLLIASAVSIVLLIACLNIACLLLSRSAARQKEMALRLSIGASRGRLIRQLLTENVLLAGLGGVASLLCVGWAARALVNVLPVGDLPFDPRQDLRALAFTAAASVVTGLLFGLIPALTTTRLELNPVLQGNSGGTTGSPRHRLAKSFVVAQVALSLALLVGAGLIVRSLGRLYRIEPGFDSEHVLSMWAYPTMLGYDHPREMRLYRDLIERLNATPGIEAASLSRYALPRGTFNFISPGFFTTMGIDLVAGRDFSDEDVASAPRVVIINERLARDAFPNQNPVGKLLPVDFERIVGGRAEIVGVVKPIKVGYRQQNVPATIYAPYTQAPAARLGQANLYIRAAGNPTAALPSVRQAILSVEPKLALVDVTTLSDQLGQSVADERSTAILLGCFGGLALALASIGLFGTMSHAVGRRTKELGIRIALGAERGAVLRMVLRETLIVVVVGVSIGIPVALAGTRLVSNLLFGIQPTDPMTLAVVVACLAAVTMLAGYLPARRAANVDPIVALRYE
jgi:ABC-type antimicrobial peptide transport system permease subunit